MGVRGDRKMYRTTPRSPNDQPSRRVKEWIDTYFGGWINPMPAYLVLVGLAIL